MPHPLKKWKGSAVFSRCRIDFKSIVIHGISESYASVHPQSLLAIINSRGVLEIALNGGNAQNHLDAQLGDQVQLTC